jgi:uncharacterized protein (TIGR03083 family)
VADIGAVYVETQERLLELVARFGASMGEPVPACPGWQVADVIRHVAGLAADVVDGTIPVDLDLMEQWRNDDVAQARDDMTARHVAARATQPLDDVVARWRTSTPDLLAVIRGERPPAGALPPGIDSVLVTDLNVHEQDIRGALDAPGARDSAGIGIGLASYGFGVAYRLAALGLPALELRYDGKSRLIGEGEVGASLAAEKFELFRAFAGRRSRAQIAALDWTGDPEPYLGLIPAYGERGDALAE